MDAGDLAPGFERIGRFFVFEIEDSWIATPTHHGTAQRARRETKQEIIDYCMAMSPEVDMLWPTKRRKRKGPPGWLIDV